MSRATSLPALGSLRTAGLVVVAVVFLAAASTAAAQPSPQSCEGVSIRADPNPVPVDRGPGTTTISWESPVRCQSEVYVSFAGREPLLFGGGPRGAQQAPWIRRGGGPYRFFLAPAADARPLAEVTVTAVQAEGGPLVSFTTPSLRWSMLWPALAFAGLAAVALAAARRRAPPPRLLLPLAALAATALATVPVLDADLRPLPDQPFPDAQEYADAARQLARGNGYVTEVYIPLEHRRRPHPPEGEPRAPRYPPGFSVALAPFAAVGTYPGNVQRGAQLLSALYVAAAAAAAWSLGGPMAAGIAASAVAAAPFATVYGGLVLSDAFAAALMLVLVATVRRASPVRAALAGVLAGAATAVRLVAGVLVPLVLVFLPAKRRLLAALCAAPFLVLLAWLQWRSYGSPLTTGYSYWFPKLRLFDLSYATESRPLGDGAGVVEDVLHGDLFQWACPCGAGGPQAELPNLLFYPAVLLGLFWIFTPPLLTLPGLVYVWRHRREPPAALTLWITGATLVCFVFYFYQGARFLAGPATLLGVWTAVAASRWLEPSLSREGLRYAPAAVGRSRRETEGAR